MRWAAATAALTAAVIPASVPGSSTLCGDPSVTPPELDVATWTGYRCMASEEAGSYWRECAPWKVYARRARDGCRGRERCCPPAAVNAQMEREAEEAAATRKAEQEWKDRQSREKLKLIFMTVLWLAWPMVSSAVIFGVIGIFLDCPGRAFGFAIAGGLVAVVLMMVVFGAELGAAAALLGVISSSGGATV